MALVQGLGLLGDRLDTVIYNLNIKGFDSFDFFLFILVYKNLLK